MKAFSNQLLFNLPGKTVGTLMIISRGKFNYTIVLLQFLLIVGSFTYSQSPVEVSGYLSEMPSYTWQSKPELSLVDNLLHNRLNINYSPNEKWNARVEFRNRLFWGETVKNTPNFKYFIENDQGWVDMSFNWGSSSSYVLNTAIDRMSLEYIAGSFQVIVGRQRVNWGQTMVWNPNDIFNSYSYFDFDYVERPGMDGVRLQYFTGIASKLEAVVKIDKGNRISTAALYRFNAAQYDFQLIAGAVNQDDYVFGGGWSGNIKGAGFYGEMSYLLPYKDGTNSAFVASVGGNYTFKNSLLLSGEYLYSSHLKSNEHDFQSLFYTQSGIRNLSIADHTYLLSTSYPLTPLVSTSLAFVGFGTPLLKNFYISPTFDYSLSDNVSVSGIFQFFFGEDNANRLVNVGSNFRLRWSF
jgi:hypothetical protein